LDDFNARFYRKGLRGKGRKAQWALAVDNGEEGSESLE
jgi:hypothetical protein